jgi:hypothetical protein
MGLSEYAMPGDTVLGFLDKDLFSAKVRGYLVHRTQGLHYELTEAVHGITAMPHSNVSEIIRSHSSAG